MAEYDPWAAYYDVIHDGLPGEAEFYVGQAVRIGGRTLELGCGTGRLAIPMAMSGIDVVGIDLSLAMLRVCREKCQMIGDIPGRLQLIQGDMERFAIGLEFDFIAMAYRTFMHLLTSEAQRRCLRAVHAHLRPGAIFAMNTWAPTPSAIALHLDDAGSETHSDYPLPEEDLLVRDHCLSRYDEHRQLLIEEHTIEVEDEAGGIVDEEHLELVRAWTTPREMDNLVRLCGFEVEAVFGDFDCTPFAHGSTEMIWVLRRSDG